MVSFLNSQARSMPRIPASRLGEMRTALAASFRNARRHLLGDPMLAIWQLLTAPLWLGSGIPAPGYPVIRATAFDTTSGTPFDDLSGPGHFLDEQIRALSRRFWLAGICAAAFRGLTIGTVICTIWAIGGLQNMTSSPHAYELLSLAIAGALAGAAFGFVIRPSATRVAEMLDRTFHLDERLTTAFDPTLAAITPGPMRRLQLADAANGFVEIRGDVRGAAVLPVREAVVAVLAAICLATALLFGITGAQIPTTSNAVVPAFVPSSERFVRQQQEQEAQQQAQQRAALAQAPKPSANADEQGKATKDLSTVGNALKDQPLTKPASDSISSGNYSGASKSLRDNAAAAKDLPQGERDALAKNLDEAASSISPDNKDLADASKQAAADLRAGGDQATKGLNDLAGQIDKTSEKATPNQAAGAAQPNTSATGSDSGSGQPSSSNPQSQAQQSQASQQSGNSQSKQPATSNTGDPGSGMAAQPGIGSEPAQNPAGESASQQKPGNAAGSGQSSQSQAGAGAGAQQAGQQSSAGAAAGAGQSSSPANNGGGQAAQSQGGDSSGKSGTSSNPSSGKASSQQAGTGGGAGQTNGPNQGASGQNNPGGGASTSNPEGKSDTAGNGKAGNPPPGNDNAGSNTGNPPSAQSGNQSLVLQGTSADNSVGTGNDIGSSSSGSGSGSGTASGNATQEKVGPAGPDSNHVPDAYREIVKGYFGGDGSTP